MDTQNDGLEKVDSFKIWPFLVSMLDFWGVDIGIEALPKRDTNVKKHGKTVAPSRNAVPNIHLWGWSTAGRIYICNDLDYTPLETNMTNWKLPIFNRKYIFIHGGFSSQSC